MVKSWQNNNNPLNYSLEFQKQINNLLSQNNDQFDVLGFESFLLKSEYIFTEELRKSNKILKPLFLFLSDNQSLWKDAFNIYIKEENAKISNEYYNNKVAIVCLLAYPIAMIG